MEWVAIPSTEDLPNPGIEPRPPELQADTLPSEPAGKLSWPVWIKICIQGLCTHPVVISPVPESIIDIDILGIWNSTEHVG